MSTDHFLYSPNPRVVLRSELITALRARAWIAFCVSDDSPGAPVQLLADGPVGTDVLIAGRGTDVAQRIEQAVRLDNQTALAELATKDEVASCAITASLDYQCSDAEMDERRPIIGPECIEGMQATRVYYVITTTMGATNSSGQLQCDAWEVLAELAGGLAEDPQAGTFEAYENGRKRQIVLPSGESEDGDSEEIPGWNALLAQARRGGFPVSEKGAVSTKGLDLAQMEGLLRIAHDCIPPNKWCSVPGALLDEFISAKSVAFADQNNVWIAEMRSRYCIVAPPSPGLWARLCGLWKQRP